MHERGLIRPILAAAIIAPCVLLAAAGEWWDRAHPWFTAAGLRAVVWLREGRDG